MLKLLQKSDVKIPIMTANEHGASIFLLASLIVALEQKGKTIKGQRILIEGAVNHESYSLKYLLECYGADNVMITN
jgi:malic enzyme